LNDLAEEQRDDTSGLYGSAPRLPFLDAFTWEADLDARIFKVAGFSEDAVREIPFSDGMALLHPEDAARIKSLIAAGNSREKPVDFYLRVRSGNGYRRYRIRGRYLAGGERYAAGVAFDAACSEEYLKRLDYLETHDELTGLYNARMLDRYYETALPEAMLPQSLIVASIDNLKEFNEAMGYHAGNALIKNVADVLSECFFDADMIARVGGGDFCAAFFGRERGEIEHRISDATMQLHKTYLNLVKANVTFGFASVSKKRIFQRFTAVR
jgi:diguanylate cyclase (GGDEF)-like protein